MYRSLTYVVNLLARLCLFRDTTDAGNVDNATTLSWCLGLACFDEQGQECASYEPGCLDIRPVDCIPGVDIVTEHLLRILFNVVFLLVQLLVRTFSDSSIVDEPVS